MVDAPGPEAGLGDGEPLALSAEQIRGRHPDVVVGDLRVPAVRAPRVAE